MENVSGRAAIAWPAAMAGPRRLVVEPLAIRVGLVLSRDEHADAQDNTAGTSSLRQ
jgi:hypothetical protein